MTKPLVDVDDRVLKLAQVFLDGYIVAPGSGDSWDYAAWDLAGEIQTAIEDWMADAEGSNRIKEVG